MSSELRHAGPGVPPPEGSIQNPKREGCICSHPWEKHGKMGCFATRKLPGTRTRNVCHCATPSPPPTAASHAAARPAPSVASDSAASEVAATVLLVSIPLALFCLALWLFLPCAFGVCGASALPAAPAGSHWTDCDALDGSGCAMLPGEALAPHVGAAPTCIRVTKMATTDRTLGGAVETANGIVCAVTASPGGGAR